MTRLPRFTERASIKTPAVCIVPLMVALLWCLPGCVDKGAAPPHKAGPTPPTFTTTTAPTSSAQAPIVARINQRPIYRSDLDKILKDQKNPSVKTALRVLVERELLLQEADGSGLGANLPLEAQARADAFLARHFSKRILCAHFTEREYGEMYIVMKPRFVRGELYEVAELHWRCDHMGPDDRDGCRTQAHQHSDHQWKPIVSAIKTTDDLKTLHQKESANTSLIYRESVVHVAGAGQSNAPKHIADAITPLSPGQATVVNALDGARLLVVLHRRPPIHRQLDDPGVRTEIRDELCPRTVQFHRNKYVHDLMRTAWLEIDTDQLPETSDVASKTTSGTAAILLQKPAKR